ncbi:MAG: hypothetical protein Q7J01_00210, partial [Syntrophales bacterium]|nr:hypothetical protein [Syntrophales bacterium]
MSEQKEFAEEILSNQTIPFKALLDSAYFAIIATDREGYLIYINEIARSLLNFKTEIKPRSTHYSEIDNDAWLDFKKIIDTGKPQITVPVVNRRGSFLV